MLVSGTIPSLANGVSQQPATARLSSQGEAQENGYSSIVEGLKKRSPTSHLAKILDGDAPDAFVHMINRDEDERYIVVAVNNTVKVFDLEGDEKTVTDSQTYLDTATPSTDLAALTIADYTFLVNKTKTVKMINFGPTFQVTFDDIPVGTDITINIAGRSNDVLTTDSVMITTSGASTPASIVDQFIAAAWWDTDELNVADGGDVLVISSNADFLNESFTLDIEIEGGLEPTIFAIPALNLEALVYVKQGNYGLNYTVNVFEGSSTPAYTFTHTTSNTDISTIRTDAIATALRAGLIALANFTTHYLCTTHGSLIKIVRADATLTAFSVTVQDSNGDRNMVAIQGSIQKFVDLPTKCFDGLVVKIEGDNSSEADDYFVQFHINDNGSGVNFGPGTWSEHHEVGVSNELDLTTMPHTLVRQSDGTFVLAQGEWASREKGDVTSSPPPSFVGRTISDIFFRRNRLGFLTDDNEVLSESGEYFNFWRTTVQAILDGDPIDVSAANEKVTLLKYALSVAEKLLLFSGQQQFIAGEGDLLTMKTASIKATTSYEITGECKPAGCGNAVYFPIPRGGFTGIREYLVGKEGTSDEAGDITAHVPSYLPSDIFKITASSNENVLSVLTRKTGVKNEIYLYKYFFVGTDKLQASWSKWILDDQAEVLNADFINSTLYLVIQREDGVYLESLPIDADRAEANMEYELLLDRRFLAGPGGTVTGTYSAVTDLTTFTLPYETEETVQAVVRDNGSIPAGYYESQMLSVTKVAGNTSITIPGDVDSVPLVIGIPYTFTYELSQIVLKQAAGQGGERPLTGGRLQLRTLTLVFDRTGYFRVEVTPLYGDTYTYHLTPKILGSYVTGSLELQSGEFRVPIMAPSDEVTIQIINDSPYPSRFLSATWEGEFILRTRRM